MIYQQCLLAQGDKVTFAWLPEPVRVGSFVRLEDGMYEVINADTKRRATEEQLRDAGVVFFDIPSGLKLAP